MGIKEVLKNAGASKNPKTTVILLIAKKKKKNGVNE